MSAKDKSMCSIGRVRGGVDLCRPPHSTFKLKTPKAICNRCYCQRQKKVVWYLCSYDAQKDLTRTTRLGIPLGLNESDCNSEVISQTAVRVVFGSQLPMDEIMRKMGVADGEGISFSKFWNLIQSVASSQHSLLSSQRGTSCGCVLL